MNFDLILFDFILRRKKKKKMMKKSVLQMFVYATLLKRRKSH